MAEKVVLFIRGLAVEATLPEGLERSALLAEDWVVLADVKVLAGGETNAAPMQIRTSSIDAISEADAPTDAFSTLAGFVAMNTKKHPPR